MVVKQDAKSESSMIFWSLHVGSEVPTFVIHRLEPGCKYQGFFCMLFLVCGQGHCCFTAFSIEEAATPFENA